MSIRKFSTTIHVGFPWRWSLLFFLLAVVHSRAEQKQFGPQELFEMSVGLNVQLSNDKSAIELTWGQLYEDDGPAAGYSYLPNEEKLGPDILVRKELLILNPGAEQAILLVGPGGNLQFQINGRKSPPLSEGKSSNFEEQYIAPPGILQLDEKAGNYWQQYTFPPGILRSGTNEFVVSGSGKVWISRDEDFVAGSAERKHHPNRSARSTDDGITWDSGHLGTMGNIDGEYNIRVFLEQYRSQGTLILPVTDAGNLDGNGIARLITSVEKVSVGIKAESNGSDQVFAYFRSGTSLDKGSGTWTDWQTLPDDGIINKPKGRFFQIKVEMKTKDPLQTPKIYGIAIEAQPKYADDDWTSRLNIVGVRNEKIVRSSIPFEYEPFDHPHLSTLRQFYRLDSVVAEAGRELELIVRLAEWSAQMWDKNGHLKEAYPPWNALEILNRHEDGTPVGGFCLQRNLVFLQACESFGLVGRIVSLSPGALIDKPRRSGHEVAEIWSNEYNKWIYVDGQFAWYAVDRETDIPLSLLELRQRQLAELAGLTSKPIKIITTINTGHSWNSITEEVPFGELRLVPRSNFLQQKYPVPLNQGMRGWFWTGHYVWTDDILPAANLYINRITRRGDFEWSVNMVHLSPEATSVPGEIRIRMDTHTPGFEAFIVQVDNQVSLTETTTFLWRLHPGRNRLEVKTRNIAGREGPPSWIIVNYE